MFFQATRGAQESKVSPLNISAKFSFLDVHDLVFLVPARYPLYSRNAIELSLEFLVNLNLVMQRVMSSSR